MTRLTAIGAFGFAAMLAAAPARAQISHNEPTLHVSDKYSSCFFDLHPELTQADFKEFAGELGSILRFRQLGDPAPLGKGRMDIGLQFTRTAIDDAKPAWNNTMSHPTADHYLGDVIAFPRIVARFGVGDRVDVGAWGGMNPQSNYGMLGADTKIALVRQGPSRPVSIAIRPSVATLIGPAELRAATAALDVSVSRAFRGLAPYAGVAASTSVAVERSPDVDLEPATAQGTLAYAGMSYRWRSLVFAGEVEKGNLVSYGFRVSTRF